AAAAKTPAEQTVEELERLRDEAVESEDYEEARRLTEIINQKKSI
ncbi:MAG: UvrB/UvrC motif-containing protein, partial [Muribaculaceae bacterium]|nr:UvrB/UvrC motif-containing protein [Muribaculaceae bacterium]